jgi:regulator of sigma E protease
MTFVWAVVLFGILIFFHELGHFIFAKLSGVGVQKFSLGFGPALIKRKIGDTEYMISVLPLGGYVKMVGEEPGEEIKDLDKDRAFNCQPVWKRALIVLAGPVFNLVLAYIVFVVFLSISLPVSIPTLKSITATIEEVADDSPAMRAGLKKDDLIVAIDGRSVSDWNEMAEIFSKNPGVDLGLRVKRGNDVIDLRVTPEPTKARDYEGKEITVGRIGISKKIDFKVIESSSIIMAFVKGAEAVYEWSALTLEVVVKMVTGGISAKQVGGPILIVDAASKAASAGAAAYFGFIAIISINLAILNLLPIPVLDGGHLMFMSIEALRGKPLSERVMNVATRIGFTMIMLLIAFVFYNDTIRIIVPWFQRKFGL